MKRDLIHLFATVLAVVAVGAASEEARSQSRQETYPAKPVRILVATVPGAPPDIIARLISEPLAMALGQPIVVENRAGAMGTIGLGALARAAADGYTLGLLAMPWVMSPALITQMPYDTVRDLGAVIQLASQPLLLSVRAGAPWQSLADLVQAAKSAPGRLSYVSPGNGTPSHVAGELLKRHVGIELHHIPFKGGPAALAALLGEQVDLFFSVPSTVGGPIKAGRLRALVATSPARFAMFPEVPTIAELGYPGVSLTDWYGVVVPAATPAPIVERLAGELRKVISQTEIRAKFESMGMAMVEDSDPAAFATVIRDETARWTRLIREAGIKAD